MPWPFTASNAVVQAIQAHLYYKLLCMRATFSRAAASCMASSGYLGFDSGYKPGCVLINGHISLSYCGGGFAECIRAMSVVRCHGIWQM
jgi:hypothetical protein